MWWGTGGQSGAGLTETNASRQGMRSKKVVKLIQVILSVCRTTVSKNRAVISFHWVQPLSRTGSDPGRMPEIPRHTDGASEEGVRVTSWTRDGNAVPSKSSSDPEVENSNHGRKTLECCVRDRLAADPESFDETNVTIQKRSRLRLDDDEKQGKRETYSARTCRLIGPASPTRLPRQGAFGAFGLPLLGVCCVRLRQVVPSRGERPCRRIRSAENFFIPMVDYPKRPKFISPGMALLYIGFRRRAV
jgi:hypothetical protein